MERKIIIEKNALTTQMAVLKNDELIHFYVSVLFENDMQDKIVIGQVMQVVKNLKAVFVDYGDEKNGMLHFKQIPDQFMDKVQPGARLPVQIVKQNIGEKGHKLTAKLNIAGRYLICLPFEPGINISKKIKNTAYRQQLKEQFLTLDNPEDYGFIIRTHAENVPVEILLEEARRLMGQVKKLMDTKDYLSKGNVLYEQPPIILQMIEEQLNSGQPYEIICNDAQYLASIKQAVWDDPLHEERKWTLYVEKLPIWSGFSLRKKIDELLKRKIWLKSGGNLIIDYTEAMTIVDVNSAKAVMTKDPERAVLQLNKEAVREVILQMLRRNLTGMIIVDLVEMKKTEHKKMIYEAAKQYLDEFEDHRTKVYPLTELGLLQFSRTKKYQCLPHQLLAPCDDCHLPFAKKSFLYDMIMLEEKAKQVQMTEHKQEIYIEVSPEYAEYMSQNHIISVLEQAYCVIFQMKKTAMESNKNILCQFYSK